jgi:hypothetical protein
MASVEIPHQPQEPALPQVVYGEGVDAAISVNVEEVAITMQDDLGISEHGIPNTTVYMDSKNRWLNKGTHYPNRIGRLRFRSNAELQKVTGDIVRISTVMKGKPLTAEQMNQTFVHELEHRAQQDRHDRKIIEGQVAILGLITVGAMLGNRIGNTRHTRMLGAAIGAAYGYIAGYTIAPHERQARQRARQVTTTAITKE